MLCRNCQKASVSRPRGLCWGCYYRPGIRELYPSTSKYARRGIGNGNIRSSLPTFPTPALPGSAEKIAVLQQRVLMRQELFHPGDATLAGVSVLTPCAG